MLVSFRTFYLPVAAELFEGYFTLDPDVPVEIHLDRSEVHYLFKRDTLVREVRSWGADALGCGLVSSFSVTVE